MWFNRIGSFPFGGVFYDAPDAGSGGGSDFGGTPDGGGSSGDGGPPTTPAEPTVYDLKDDALVRVNGQGEPVKFSAIRGFQSQWTKASQEAARLKQQLTERDNRLRQIEQAQQQERQRQAAGQSQDFYSQLRQAPYLTGEDAAGFFERIESGWETRDKISLALVKKVQDLERTLSGLNESHVGSQFDSKIQRWVGELGLPPEASDLAKEIYLAYEGDDLDNEFPTILRNRWEQMVRVIQASQAAKVAANRKQPFIPGKGGGTGPSRGLQLDPRMSASQVADELWPMFQESDT